MAGIQYRKGEIDFSMGDTIFVYIDGVTEATNWEEKLYGEERLGNILNNTDAESAKDICQKVKENVDAFVGEVPQFDDITMLCVRLGCTDDKEVMQMSEITVEATVANIEVVTEFVNARLEELNCSAKVQTQINIAIDELFRNIAHYAYYPNWRSNGACSGGE